VEVEAEPTVEVSAGELQDWHVLVFGFKNVIWTIPAHPLQRVSEMESMACTHQPWRLGHDIVGVYTFIISAITLHSFRRLFSKLAETKDRTV
jgi:hypothetical protein